MNLVSGNGLKGANFLLNIWLSRGPAVVNHDALVLSEYHLSEEVWS